MEPASARRSTPGPFVLVVTAAVLLFVCAGLWIVGTVPSGGPDEPWHIVRGAALVRGDLDGQVLDDGDVYFEVPAWAGHPAAFCFRLDGEQPATCATAEARPAGDALLLSRADNYPIWGHLAAGLGTFFPAAVGNQAARLFDAAIPIGLLLAGFALAARRGGITIAAAALAITPMVWFSVIVVNPSGLAIAGGFALWAGLLASERLLAGRPDRLAAWTIAAGWAAASLPRRDGAIWAALIVGLCAAAGVIDLRRLVIRLGVGPIVLIAVSIVATSAWAVTSATSSSKLLVFAPVLPIVGAAFRRAWVRATTGLARVATVGTVAVGVLLVGAFITLNRPGGFERPIFGRLVGQTGNNIEEAIGLLGWLDTPLPRLALFGWFAAFGILTGVALLRGRRRAVGLAVAVLGTGVIVSWLLELTRGETAGYYWQGRYYLPLLVGVPMILGWPLRRVGVDAADELPGASVPTDSGRADVGDERAVASLVLAASLTVLTLAFGASMRRWALGNSGSVLPWTWNTYDTAVPPLALLVAHAAVCVALYLFVSRWVAPATEPVVDDRSSVRPRPAS